MGRKFSTLEYPVIGRVKFLVSHDYNNVAEVRSVSDAKGKVRVRSRARQRQLISRPSGDGDGSRAKTTGESGRQRGALWASAAVPRVERRVVSGGHRRGIPAVRNGRRRQPERQGS